MPSSEGHPLAALFHAGIPAWAVQPDGHVFGVLWRNAQLERCDIYGPSGSDTEEHTMEYALRVASGLTGPEQGAPLREALAFQTPLQTIVGTPSGTLPRSFSLASASPDMTIITAAKVGSGDPETLVLRFYQPTNAALNVNVRSAASGRFPSGWRLDVQGRTALESALPTATAKRLAVAGSSDAFTFVAARALTTITLGKKVR